MDAHNLAVVFGPTLIRVSEEDDMISSQGHFNKVLETIIKSYDLVFDGDGVDAVDTVDEFDDDEEEAQKTEDEVSRDEAEDSESDDELEPKEAKALYNYTARSGKELSFNKGDIIQVYKRSNNDWWDGCLDGLDGFIPCAYIQVLDEDNVDGVPNKETSSESRQKPQSLVLDRDDTFPSPPSSTRATPTTPVTPSFVRSPVISGDDVTRSQLHLRHVHKTSTPEVIPEEQHMSSFKRSSFKRSESPTTNASSVGTVERTRSLEKRDSPKTVEEGNKTASLPRTAGPGALWQRRGVEPMSPAGEPRGIAEGMNSPSMEMAPQQFTRAPPPAPKPKPKPKVPKRNSNPSTELIASLQAGAMARNARESREEIPSTPDELPPPPPPCSEREVIGGEGISPPCSPVSKQDDTFL